MRKMMVRRFGNIPYRYLRCLNQECSCYNKCHCFLDIVDSPQMQHMSLSLYKLQVSIAKS
jgi:hypothetical protein